MSPPAAACSEIEQLAAPVSCCAWRLGLPVASYLLPAHESMMTGAFLTHFLLPSDSVSKAFCQPSGSRVLSQMRKRHGSSPLHDIAQRPASRSAVSASRGTGRFGSYARELQRRTKSSWMGTLVTAFFCSSMIFPPGGTQGRRLYQKPLTAMGRGLWARDCEACRSQLIAHGSQRPSARCA